MSFDGSFTPPLTDDENDCLEGLDSSPVLRKRMKRNTETLRRNGPQNVSNHGTTMEDENIQRISTKAFRCETDIEQRFYAGMMSIRQLKMQSSFRPLSSRHRKDDPVQCLSTLFADIKEFFTSSPQEELVFSTMRLLSMLCNEASSIHQCSRIPAYRHVVTNFVQSNKRTFLHQANETTFIGLYHAYIKAYTCLIEITPHVCQRYPLLKLDTLHFKGQPLVEFSELNQQIYCKVLLDLLSAGANLFNFIVGKENSSHMIWKPLLTKSPFPCECYQTFFAAQVSMQAGDQQFWIILNSYLSNILQTTLSKDNNLLSITNTIKFESFVLSLSFAWWWLRDMPFECDAKYPLAIVSRLLRLSLRNCESEDAALTFHLACYRDVILHMRKQSLLSMWTSAELAPYHLLWHHFSQKFLLPKAKTSINTCIQKYFCRETSVGDLLSTCRSFTNLEFTKPSDMNIDSFCVFLNILSIVARENSGESWSQVNDRLLSKIQLASVKHMNESGLHRFFCLIITLMMSLSQNDSKLVLKEWLSLCDNSNLTCGKATFSTQKLLITGFYSIISICNENQLSFEAVAIKISKNFSQVCRLLTMDAKAAQRLEIWKLFTMYVENFVTTLQTSSTYCLGQEELLPLGSIDIVLDCCKSYEEVFLATNISDMLTSISGWTKGNKINNNVVMLYNRIARQVLPWLKKACVASEQAATCCDIACQLTTMSKHMNVADKNSPVVFSNIWKFFASEGKVNPSLRCSYLEKVLSEGLLEEDCSADAEEAAIQGWIRCCYSLADANLLKLNREVSKLHVIQKICSSYDESFDIKTLTSALASHFLCSKNFLDRVSWSGTANKLFMPTVDSAVRAIKSPSVGGGSIMCAYCCVSRVVEDCANLLFSNGKSSYISKVVENYILPYNTSQLSPQVNQGLLHTLHKFILGLLKLGQKSIFLQKTISDIFRLHLTRWQYFTTIGTLKYPHPFLKVLLHTSVDQDERDWLLKQLVTYCTRKSSVDIMTVVVEILHYWISHKSTPDQSGTVKMDSLSGFISIIQQARIHLRPNESLVDKANTILQDIRTDS